MRVRLGACGSEDNDSRAQSQKNTASLGIAAAGIVVRRCQTPDVVHGGSSAVNLQNPLTRVPASTLPLPLKNH